MTLRATLGKRVAPWRFVMFFVILVAAGVAAGTRLPLARATLVAFDLAALAFLVSCWWLFDDQADDMRSVARETDANRKTLLVLSFLLTVVIFAAVGSELGQADELEPLHKALVAVSLILVWLFGNAVYTLHYCHLFYTSADGGKDAAGLVFPETEEPLMSDFVYFAYTLGVAVQTSDVAITSGHIRKVATARCGPRSTASR